MKKKILQINSKWSETRKKHETADPSAAATADRRPILPVEYVNTSNHTTFHQNISINVACVQKEYWSRETCKMAPPPLLIYCKQNYDYATSNLFIFSAVRNHQIMCMRASNLR